MLWGFALSVRGLLYGPIPHTEKSYRVSEWVSVCACVSVCARARISLSAIRCKNNTLHLQWIGRRGHNKKERNLKMGFYYRIYSSSSIGSATLVGFSLLNYRWVFSAGRFLQSAVASGTSNPQPGGPVILERSNSRHKESPASETTQANPSSGRWNYGREIAENFTESGEFHVNFGFFYDMGPTALLLLRRKARCGSFRPKNPTASVGFEPANSGTKGQHAHL